MVHVESTTVKSNLENKQTTYLFEVHKTNLNHYYGGH